MEHRLKQINFLFCLSVNNSNLQRGMKTPATLKVDRSFFVVVVLFCFVLFCFVLFSGAACGFHVSMGMLTLKRRPADVS